MANYLAKQFIQTWCMCNAKHLAYKQTQLSYILLDMQMKSTKQKSAVLLNEKLNHCRSSVSENANNSLNTLLERL